jgi:hypothetical protein
MPAALNVGAYRFFIYSGEGEEPPHIHIERDGKVAKYWLGQFGGGFRSLEIARLSRLVTQHEIWLLEAWK